MAASYLNRLDASFGAYGVNGYVFTPDFIATHYSKEIIGSSPALVPAEVASKIYDTLTTDAPFMTVQYMGLASTNSKLVRSGTTFRAAISFCEFLKISKLSAESLAHQKIFKFF
jgi:hypothetical protein